MIHFSILLLLLYFMKNYILFVVVKLKERQFYPFTNIKINRNYLLFKMNDICNQMQTNNSIQHNFKQFTISLTFQNTPHMVLHLIIQNNFTSQSYRADVDSTFLAQNQDLKRYFDNPGELYKFLSNIIDEIMISSDGKMQFELKFHGFQKSKLITIKTAKITGQKLSQLEKQHQNMKSQMKKINKIIGNLIQCNKRLEEKNIDLQKKIKKFANSSIAQSQSLGFHCANSHYGNYIEKRMQKSIIITKVTKDETSYRFINSGQILQNTMKSYRARLIYVPKGWLSLGFCDREFFNSKGFHHQSPHFLNYGCDGMMHQNGSSKQAAVTSAAGQVITCTVYLRDKMNKVTSRKDNFLIAERMLPQCMRNRTLYFASVTCLQKAAYELEENMI